MALLLLTLVLGGCASTPPPLGELARAEQALKAAQDAEAEQFAPVDWRLASQTLADAQAKIGAKQYADATRLLGRARVHAELARLRAENAHTRSRIEAQERENAKLRQDLLGDRQ
ncbi:MAG: DUF4398 domain-containing protein [Xanthomonadales bacterium]|nr:DUF4398 domain-containing protein [Xanthomonadales bacterium]